MLLTTTTTAMAAPELLLLPDTLADRLRAQDTQAAALQALDKLPPPCPPELALAAAPALVDVAAATEEREVLDRCGLLLARLLAEALPDPSAVYGAALGGERLAAWYAPHLLVAATQRALGNGSGEGGRQPLGREDAYSFACMHAWLPSGWARGATAPEAAAGRTVMEFLRIVRSLLPSLFLLVVVVASSLPPRALADSHDTVSTHLSCCAVGLGTVDERPPDRLEEADAVR
eukprot:COSAG02_NODE_14_length_56855_cov_512.793661_36_plen_232_part_00